MTPSTDPATRDASSHERSGPPGLGDPASFPSNSELARTLTASLPIATLGTLTHSGHPYSSIAPFSTLTGGAPLVCISDLAEHTQNLQRDPRASVLVRCEPVAGVDPLARPRVTLTGSFVPHDVTSEEIAAPLERHPSARPYIGFGDFSWWRFEVVNARYVGGFGVMGWCDSSEYAAATPDPIIPVAMPMIEHLNQDHPDACRDIVRVLAGCADVVAADVTDLDRYGVTFAVRNGPASPDMHAIARVAFPEPLVAPDDVRAATVELVRRAR
ncbi:MAG: HugZ family protein [Ilumatobacter sp.]